MAKSMLTMTSPMFVLGKASYESGHLPTILLKLAARAKFHMGHLIYDNWYFSWIPLSERCRIYLNILWFWHVQMKLWIYFDYGQIVKVGQQNYVGSEAQQSRLFIFNMKDHQSLTMGNPYTNFSISGSSFYQCNPRRSAHPYPSMIHRVALP